MLRTPSIIFSLMHWIALFGAEESLVLDPIIIPLKRCITISNSHKISLDYDVEQDAPILSRNKKEILNLSRLPHIFPFYPDCSEITIEGVALYNNKIITAMVMQLKSAKGIFVDIINYDAMWYKPIVIGSGRWFIWMVGNADVQLASIAIDEAKNRVCCIGTSENIRMHTDWLDIVSSYDSEKEESAAQAMIMMEQSHNNKK